MLYQHELINYVQLKCKTVSFLSHETIKSPSERNVHDLRVNLRRLMTTIQFLKFVYTNQCETLKILKKQKKKLNNMFNELSDLRDTQALIMYLKNDLQTSNSVIDLIYMLESKEIKQLKEVPQKLKQWELVKIETQLLSVLKNQMGSPQEIEQKIYLYKQSLTKHLHGRIDALYSSSESFHKVRIGLKKLRYFLELQEESFCIKQPLLAILKSWQDRLGHLQDLVVLLSYLEYDDFLKSNESIALKSNFRKEVADLKNILLTDISNLKMATKIN